MEFYSDINKARKARGEIGGVLLDLEGAVPNGLAELLRAIRRGRLALLGHAPPAGKRYVVVEFHEAVDACANTNRHIEAEYWALLGEWGLDETNPEFHTAFYAVLESYYS